MRPERWAADQVIGGCARRWSQDMRFAGPIATICVLLTVPVLTTAQDMEPVTTQPTSLPAAAAQPLPQPREADLYRELLREEERPTRVLPQTGAAPIRPSITSSAPRVGKDGLLTEGTLMIDRPGRLVRTAERSEFQFIVDESDPDPRTMEILKNGLLEAVERESDAGVKEFYITARITRYRDANYLLLLKYRRQLSHGNLGP